MNGLNDDGSCTLPLLLLMESENFRCLFLLHGTCWFSAVSLETVVSGNKFLVGVEILFMLLTL